MNKNLRIFLLAVLATMAVALNVFGVMPVKATQVFLNTILIGIGLVLVADLLIRTRLRERS
ncbi:hypothetical protein [Cesiribacter andamanensis]|uniref:Uncharacterized protein n=1 Tax=Cesiribacter andamanensis AMV16 TaxID=1279009 RepID=M7NHW0_9BACT|nr:hypothetical protein [Cesiribacter andamanensis]EMR01395.1 hypothetical protein ADICEAN_03483 [Cesiribacter andamanensis AMV16]